MIKKVKVELKKDTLQVPDWPKEILKELGLTKGTNYIGYFDLIKTEGHNADAHVTIKVSPANVYSPFGIERPGDLREHHPVEWAKLMRQYFRSDTEGMTEEELQNFSPTKAQLAKLNSDLQHSKWIGDFRIECYKDGQSAGKVHIANVKEPDDVNRIVEILENANAEAFNDMSKSGIINAIPELANILGEQKTKTKEAQVERGHKNRTLLNQNIWAGNYDFGRNTIKGLYDIKGSDGRYVVRMRTAGRRADKEAVEIKGLKTMEEAKLARDIFAAVNRKINEANLKGSEIDFTENTIEEVMNSAAGQWLQKNDPELEVEIIPLEEANLGELETEDVEEVEGELVEDEMFTFKNQKIYILPVSDEKKIYQVRYTIEKDGKPVAINLGNFDGVINAKKAIDFFQKNNEDVATYFDGTIGYINDNPRLSEEEIESINNNAAKYKKDFQKIEEKPKNYEKEGNKYTVYYTENGVKKRFGSYDNEAEAIKTANLVNESKDVKALLTKMINRSLLEEFETGNSIEMRVK